MPKRLDVQPTILVISNNADELRRIEEGLKSKDYEVLSTMDGYEGLMEARSKMPGLIITSLTLSRISGAKVIRLLKFDKKYSTMPVISILDKETPENLKLIRKLKVDRYITRPVDLPDLLMNIRNLFSEAEIGGFIEEALL